VTDAKLPTPTAEHSAETSGALPRRPVYRTLKRALDVVAAGAGLIVLSPLFLVAALAVRLDSRGPVFFIQQRVGRGFVPFGILKFRTMVVDAEARGGQITSGNDSRVTKSGRWLRKTKLDELPQLINVLRGDMSLVGPRPEVPKYVEMCRDDYVTILAVRPGLTDPASIKYRDESAVLAASDDPERAYVEQVLPDKIALARDYVQRATLFGDLRLLVQTFLRIVR
jgi:lipopolysaccharide/colanic/teichoic acid biosynthesis glycosyltransferase